MNNSHLKIILDKKDIVKWRKIFNTSDKNNTLTPVECAEALTSFIKNDNSYFEFAKVIWNFFKTDEDHQSILWIWFEEIFRLDYEYADFLVSLSWNFGNIECLEYLFDLITLFYLPIIREKDIDYFDTKFHLYFLKHKSPEILASTQLFLYQENIISKISDDIFLFFDKLIPKLQEKLLDPIFNSLGDKKLKEWLNIHIKYSFNDFNDRIKTGIIIQILNHNLRFHTFIPVIKQVIEEAKSVFLRETILLYILPSEIITQPLVEPILDVFLNEDNLENNLILLRYLPQYFDNWPPRLKEKILKLFNNKNSEVRSAILLLLSPTWINGDLLIAGLSDKNKTVQNAAIQSAAILFQKIDQNLRNKVFLLLQSPELSQNEAFGFFLGYNYNVERFESKIIDILSLKDDKIEDLLIYCLRGLILNWQKIPKKLKDLIENNTIENWSENIKISLYESFRLSSSELDDQGKDLVEFLANEQNFLSIDIDIK